MIIRYLIFIAVILASCKEVQNQTTMETQPTEIKKELLFVGTYTDKEGHVDGQADGIYALEFDPSISQLSPTSLKATTTNPSYIYVDSENKRVYAVNEKVGEGEMIAAFSYDETGMKFLNSVPAEGGAPCYITKVDGHLLTANYGGGNHGVFKLNEDGSIGNNTQLVNNSGPGLTSRQSSPHAHMIISNPHTKQVLGVDLGTDKVTFFNFDAKIGKLDIAEELKLEGGSGPRHVAFHPAMDIIYVVNELNGTIEVVKKMDGTYQSIQNIISTRNPNNEDAGCGDILVHPSGKFLFASNRGPFNTISQYRIEDDGSLKFYAERTSNGEVPRAFTLDPSGKFLLVANQNSDNIAIFIFDEASGQLLDSGNDFSAPTPVCLKFE